MGTRLPHHQHYTTPEKGLLQRAAHLTWLWLVLDKPFSSSIHLPEVLDHQMAQSVAARRLHSERKKKFQSRVRLSYGRTRKLFIISVLYPSLYSVRLSLSFCQPSGHPKISLAQN